MRRGMRAYGLLDHCIGKPVPGAMHFPESAHDVRERLLRMSARRFARCLHIPRRCPASVQLAGAVCPYV